MVDKWIVTERFYKEHTTLAAAEAERARRLAKDPSKPLRVLRIKTFVSQSGFFPEILAFVRRIAVGEPGVPDLIKREAADIVARHDKQAPPRQSEAA